MSVYPDDSRPVPKGAYTPSSVKALQSVTESSARAEIRSQALVPWREGRANFFTNIIGGIGKAFILGLKGITGGISDLFKPISEAAIEVSDGQIDLEGRLELLDGVRGYAAAYQSLNILSDRREGFFSHGLPGYRFLPFNKQLGPTRGAHIDTDEGGIVFDEPGLWTVYVHCYLWGGSSIFDAPKESPSDVRVTVLSKGGNRFSHLDSSTSGKAGVFQSYSLSFPVVIPEAGYRVIVEGKAEHNRAWRGGTYYSRLAVVKHDSRVTNLGQGTVPDER
ncbi:hypothetical protein [Corynebacterium urealyticum]|uniref:hypothetical protein n=1 Tax=Corynebacterium urealyticum TaxID=43771 RepID=UPI00293EDFCC|nr:hypothetical protein [Corynebacterium urealyticum]WOH94981.1 hypothetical protein RZ943_03025 [Corynebacterium urealyticum]